MTRTAEIIQLQPRRVRQAPPPAVCAVPEGTFPLRAWEQLGDDEQARLKAEAWQKQQRR